MCELCDSRTRCGCGSKKWEVEKLELPNGFELNTRCKQCKTVNPSLFSYNYQSSWSETQVSYPFTE
jgi:hypothetical protein